MLAQHWFAINVYVGRVPEFCVNVPCTVGASVFFVFALRKNKNEGKGCFFFSILDTYDDIDI